jgi:hypothetical protein
MKKTILTILSLALASLALDVNKSPIKDITDSAYGIGPKIGEKLDSVRKASPITSCDDLEKRVKGIGKKKAAVLCPLFHLSMGRRMPESLAMTSNYLGNHPQAKRTSHAKPKARKQKEPKLVPSGASRSAGGSPGPDEGKPKTRSGRTT